MNQPRRFRLTTENVVAIQLNGTLRRDLEIAEAIVGTGRRPALSGPEEPSIVGPSRAGEKHGIALAARCVWTARIAAPLTLGVRCWTPNLLP